MVDSTPKCPVFLLPPDSVVKGAAGEESYGCKREDSEGNSTLKPVGCSNKDEPSDQRNRGHHQMDQTPRLGFWGSYLFGQFHGSTIGRRAPNSLGVSDLGFPDLFGVGGVKPVLTTRGARGYYSRLLFSELSACNRVQ